MGIEDAIIYKIRCKSGMHTASDTVAESEASEMTVREPSGKKKTMEAEK